VQKEAPEAQRWKSPTSRSPVNYREVDVIFGACPLEGSTLKKRSIYINEACKANYPMVLIGPPLTRRKLIMFSKEDAYAVHFPHNDTLIVTMHLDNCRVSRILVDSESSVNILHGGALDIMEDTSKVARAMINPQTQSNLYGFDRNETQSPDTISLSVRTDLYNVIMEFFMIDIESPHNAISISLGST